MFVCKKEEEYDTTNNRFANSFANFKHCAFNCFLYEIILRRGYCNDREHYFICCFGFAFDNVSNIDKQKKQNGNSKTSRTYEQLKAG